MLQVPDKLCQPCLRIFETDWKHDDQHDFNLDPASASGCRLCALLVSRFILDRNVGKKALVYSFFLVKHRFIAFEDPQDESNSTWLEIRSTSPEGTFGNVRLTAKS